jgi:hypothetical protein
MNTAGGGFEDRRLRRLRWASLSRRQIQKAKQACVLRAQSPNQGTQVGQFSVKRLRRRSVVRHVCLRLALWTSYQRENDALLKMVVSSS